MLNVIVIAEDGWEIGKLILAIQPLKSVTSKLYDPAGMLFKSWVVPPFDQE